MNNEQAFGLSAYLLGIATGLFIAVLLQLLVGYG